MLFILQICLNNSYGVLAEHCLLRTVAVIIVDVTIVFIYLKML